MGKKKISFCLGNCFSISTHNLKISHVVISQAARVYTDGKYESFQGTLLFNHYDNEANRLVRTCRLSTCVIGATIASFDLVCSL